MPKDKNERIEGVFGQIGLGNKDPERIVEIREQYERAMALADFVRGKKGRRFRDELFAVEEKETKKAKEKPKPKE